MHHIPYSPDLALCDLNLKKYLRGNRYTDDEVLKAAMTKNVDKENYFNTGLKKCIDRSNKCIEIRREHIEK